MLGDQRPGESGASSTGRRDSTIHRLVGVDAARGLALLGMIAVHVTPAVGLDGESTGVYLVASGRASALFALLAGVGLALASGGAEAPRGTALRRAWSATAVRAVLLVVVGLLIGAPDSGVAVILVYYGLLFLLAMPFLALGARVLLPLAAAWAMAAPFVNHAVRLDMPSGPGENPTMASLADPAGLVQELLFTGYYPVFPWIAYLLAGLGLGRLAIGRRGVAVKVLAGGAVLGAATYALSWFLLRLGVMERLIEAGTGMHPTNKPFTDGVLTTSFYGTTPTTSWWWLTVASPHTATPFDLLHTIGTSAAVLGLALLIGRRWPGALSPLAAIGSMTFTLYSTHVLLLATVLPGALEYSWLMHMAVAFLIAVPWRRNVGRGPLEALAAFLVRAVQAPSRSSS